MRQVDHSEKNMLLSSYDVNQQLIHQCSRFLLKCTRYPTLKSYLVEKKIIQEIHQPLIQEINQLKDEDKKQAQYTIEQAILEQQISEDKKEQTTDNQEAYRYHEQYQILNNELAQNTSRVLGTEGALTVLQEIIARKAATHPPTHPTIVHLHGNTAIHPYQDPELLRMQRERLVLLNRINDLHHQLHVIKQQTKQLHDKSEQREQRLQARLALAQNIPGTTILHTLSKNNTVLLMQKTQQIHKEIEFLSSTLINKAEHLNYSVFMQQLESCLSQLKLATSEITALEQTIKMMKEHFTHLDAAHFACSELNKTKQNIASLEVQLQKGKAQVIAFQQTNPALCEQNKQLIATNQKLAAAEKNYQLSHDKLLTPTWILASFALLASIPLFLTLGGVIPMVLAPLAFFIFVSIVPIVSFLASLGTGTAALIFFLKKRLNNKEMASNARTIEQNTQQVRNNEVEILTLQNKKIPTYEQQIAEYKHIKIQLEDSVQKENYCAEQLLCAAKKNISLPYPPVDPTLPPYEAKKSYCSLDYGFFNQQAPIPNQAPPSYTDPEPYGWFVSA